MIRIDGGGASGEVDFEPVSSDELNEAQAERAQKAALDNAGVTGNSGFSPSPSPSAAELSGNATVAADNGLGTFRASQLIGVSSANLSGVASSLSAEASTSADAGTVDSVSATAAAIVSGDTDAALSALSDLVGGTSTSPNTGRAHALSTRGGDGADGAEGVEGTEGVDGTHVDGTGAPTPGPYPGVEVRLNGEVLSLNDAIARGSQLPMRDQMTLVMQLVDQNLPAPVPGGSPMTVNGINLAVTTHKDFDFAAAVQRLQSPGGGNSEDRAIVPSELLAQMGVPRDRMQISYGSFCDPSGKKLYSQAELLVCVPDRPLPQPNAEAPSTWYAMKERPGSPARQPDYALGASGTTPTARWSSPVYPRLPVFDCRTHTGRQQQGCSSALFGFGSPDPSRATTSSTSPSCGTQRPVGRPTCRSTPRTHSRSSLRRSSPTVRLPARSTNATNRNDRPGPSPSCRAAPLARLLTSTRLVVIFARHARA